MDRETLVSDFAALVTGIAEVHEADLKLRAKYSELDVLTAKVWRQVQEADVTQEEAAEITDEAIGRTGLDESNEIVEGIRAEAKRVIAEKRRALARFN